MEAGGINSLTTLPRHLRWLREFSRRWLNPLTVRFAGRFFYARLFHTGRRSGKEYQTPVFAQPTPDGFIIPLTYGEVTDWYQNLRTADSGQLQRRSVMYTISNPTIIPLKIALPHFPPLLRLILRWLRIRSFLQVMAQSESKPDIAGA
jgi:deazaflavin-dependent oxidoreductase (nitroreductase family)